MKNIQLLYSILSSHERKIAGLLLIMILIMAILDMIGVASILPFIAVLSNPTLIDTNSILNLLYQKSSLLGVETKDHFLFLLGVIVFIHSNDHALLGILISFSGIVSMFGGLPYYE